MGLVIVRFGSELSVFEYLIWLFSFIGFVYFDDGFEE